MSTLMTSIQQPFVAAAGAVKVLARLVVTDEPASIGLIVPQAFAVIIAPPVVVVPTPSPVVTPLPVIIKPSPTPAPAPTPTVGCKPSAAMGCANGKCPTDTCALSGLGMDVLKMICYGVNVTPQPLLVSAGCVAKAN